MRLALETAPWRKEFGSSRRSNATSASLLALNGRSKSALEPFKAVARRSRKVVVSASGEQSPGLSSRADAKEPFRAATQRLNNLLSGVGDGSEELEKQFLEEESAELKVLLAGVAGGCISGAAAVICLLIHSDPLGGATLSLSSLQHAALGLAAAAPVAGAKLLGWRPEGHRALPLLADIHDKEARRMQPLFAGMTPMQAAVVATTEIVSSVLLLFPAAEGSLQLLLHMYSNRLRELGWEMPGGADFLLALVLLAAVNGFGRASEHAPSAEEFEVVGDAVSNAERYYKLFSREAERMSAAFVMTAEAWFEQRVNSGMASAVLGFAEILFLGGLWQWTHDLSTPMAAALLSYGADFAGIYRSQRGAARRD